MFVQSNDNDQRVGIDDANGIIGQWNSLVSQQQDLLSRLLEENKKLKSQLEISDAENIRMKKAIDAFNQGSLADLSKPEQEERPLQSTEGVSKTRQAKQDKGKIFEEKSTSASNEQSRLQIVRRKQRTLPADTPSTRRKSSVTSDEGVQSPVYRPPFKENGSKKGWASSQGGNRPPENWKPCNAHYLLGQCVLPECQYEHWHDLSEADLQRLRAGAKQQPCKYVNENEDCWAADDCIYGHKCPYGSQCRNLASKSCRFVGKNMHAGDDSDIDPA